MEAVTTQDINKSLLNQTGITLGNISRLNITLILAWIYLFPHSKGAFTFFGHVCLHSSGSCAVPGT